MASELQGAIPDPQKTVNTFVKALNSIEKFAKKGSEEHNKGNHALGHFYNVCTLMLLSLFAIIIIVAIYGIGSLLPENLQWITILILAVPIIGLFYFTNKTLT